MERIILFNVPNIEQIKKIAAPMHIKVFEADTSRYNETLGQLSLPPKKEMPSDKAAFSGKAPSESLLLFCDITDKKLDKILFQLKRNNIQIDFKAVLTPTNASWNVLKLYLEMQREKLLYS